MFASKLKSRKNQQIIAIKQASYLTKYRPTLKRGVAANQSIGLFTRKVRVS